MKTTFELNAEMETKLKEAGIPFETVKVFGVIRTNVHVVCLSRAAAQKWSTLLNQVFGSAPTVVATRWEAKIQKGTCLRPTMRNGYLVGAVGK